MEEIQQVCVRAAEQLSSGNVKDAYFTYIGALDVASKELHSIKFVNNVVTSKPPSVPSIFKTLQACLVYAEDIINKNQSSILTSRKNANLNISVHPPTPLQEDPTDTTTSPRAPPIPPKPMRRSTPSPLSSPRQSYSVSTSPPTKPPLPPKPTRTGSVRKLLREYEAQTAATTTATANDSDNADEGGGEDADNSDSDSDDEDEDSGQGTYSTSDNNLKISSDTSRRRSASPNLSIIIRKESPVVDSVTDSQTDEESPSSAHAASSPPTLSYYASMDQNSHPLSFLYEKSNVACKAVYPEGAVDPTNIVEATVITDIHNMQNPSSPTSISFTDHVPKIPASPLLTSHSRLEQKIRVLETKIAEYRAVSKDRESGVGIKDDKGQLLSDLTDEEISDAIREFNATLAASRRAITKTLKLVQKAAIEFDALQFPPYLIAYQLTLIESAIFLEIDPTALLTHSLKTPDAKITASTDFFNYLTRLVELTILTPTEAATRAQIIHHWVKVAVKLNELQNYQTLKAILSALGTPPIMRLKRTWTCIPKKSTTKLETLNEMMSEARNYQKYREFIQKKGFARRTMVPFLGTFIMDATYLLAAVKSQSQVGSSQHGNGPPPPTPNSTSVSVSTPSSPNIVAARDDPRVQELLQTMHRYQTGPKFSSTPPSPYVKSSTKHNSHFRTASLSAALYRGGYKRNDDDDETLEEKQCLITHYLLTRPWMPEKSVDELSILREPPKYKNGNTSSSQRNSGGRLSSSLVSNPYSESTSTITTSEMGRTSSGGSNDSRPNSMEDSGETVVSKLERAVAFNEKDFVKEKDKDKRNLTDMVNRVLFGPRSSLDKSQDREKDKLKTGDRDRDRKSDESDTREDSYRILSDTIFVSSPTSNKRRSWRTGAKKMFGAPESDKPYNRHSSKSDPPPLPKVPTHARTSSAASPTTKSSTYVPTLPARRSLDEIRTGTPPPLMPKPATLMQRSASASSASGISGGGSVSVAGGSRLSLDGAEDIRMALARKVASEVVAARKEQESK
ncbi:2198_t:CDS:2 [Paraglomus occultum]|uniref:2198_t:CDS:1 n=1 Tax=Paraglomus occultum TaxID=144539 RepID=A0A9N8VRS3_9GLOM|nr:2198_t:CDS:2 [Paraglomus occultum]